MKSITKTNLDSTIILKLCRKHFPDVGNMEVREFTGGAFNAVYLIKGSGLPDGCAVLKAGPKPDTETLTYEKNMMQAEIGVYGMLQDKDIPIPQIYAVDFSGKVIPSNYYFMEFMQGKTWKDCIRKIPPEDKPNLMQQLGRFNGAIHSIEGSWFGYIKEDKRFRFDTWGDAYAAMMTDILNDGRVRSCKLPYEAIEAVVQKHYYLLNEIHTPRLVSFDMWAGNVFVKPENGHYAITGFVDFERSFYGDPYADFTSAVMLFNNVEAEPDFIAGYEEASGQKLAITKEDKIRMDLYRLYMASLMWVETYRYKKAFAFIMRTMSKNQILKLLQKL